MEGTSFWIGDQHLWDLGDESETAGAHSLAASYVINMGCFPDMESVKRFFALATPWFAKVAKITELSSVYATLYKINFEPHDDPSCEIVGAQAERLMDAFVDASTRVVYDKDADLLWIGESSFGPDTRPAMKLLMDLAQMAGASEETLECLTDFRFERR